MKKQLLHWAYLLVAGLALGACGGDDAEDTPTPPTPSTPTGKWSVTIKAGVDETRGLSLSGTTLSVNWSTSETVYAYYGGQKVGELHPTANSNTASVTLQGELESANYSTGQSLTLKFPRETNEYTGQAGTIEDIAAKYDYLEATVSISTIDATSHTMTVNEAANFTSKQAIARLKFDRDLASGDVITITNATNTADPVTLATVTLASDVLAAADGYVYVALPLTDTGTSYNLKFTVARSEKDAYEGTLANKTLQNNKFYGASVKLYASTLEYATLADIGRVIGADGKLYDNATSATDASTQAVAVIAYVGAAGSADASSTTYRGLAIAMEYCNKDNTGTGNWNGTGSTNPWCNKTVQCNTEQNTDISIVRNWKDGISKTTSLVENTDHNHWAAKAAKNYNVSVPSTGTSGWFLPSIGQWQLIIKGLVTKQDNLSALYDEPLNYYPNSDNKMKSGYFNSILTAAGAALLQTSGHWSCSEYNNSSAWRVMFQSGYANQVEKNNNNNYVRAVLAF